MVTIFHSFSLSLRAVLADHMNAEIVAGTITSKQDAMDYVTWTYYFRRLLMNPSYYQLEEASKDGVNTFLSRLVSGALSELEASYCVEFEEVSGMCMCSTSVGVHAEVLVTTNN